VAIDLALIFYKNEFNELKIVLNINNSPLLKKLVRYFSSNLIAAGFNFFTILFSARYLTARELGIVAMFQLLVTFTTIFLSVNVDSALSRKYFETDSTPEKLKNYVGSAFQILSITSAVIIIIYFLFRNLISDSFSLGYNLLFWGILSTLSNIIIEIRLSQWRIRGDAKKFMVFQICNSGLNFFLTIIIVTFFLPNAIGRISSIVMGGFVFAVLSIISLTRDDMYSIYQINKENLIEIVKFGGPLIPHTLGILLLTFFDRFFIKNKLGLENTGLYVLGVQFAGVLGLLFESLNSAIMPWIYEKLNTNTLNEKKYIVINTYKWYLLVIVIAIFIVVFGPYFINIVTSNKYNGSTTVLKLLVFGQVFSGMYLMKSNYIYFVKKTKWISIITILSGCLNILLCILLIGEYGINGVALSFMISMAFRFSLTWILANKYYPMPWLFFLSKS
jgi:O-antigen/teichoic acid export membrane protein